jgi:hypothetical protein
MKKILIFCEGVTDQIFIADCIEKFYGIEVTRSVIDNKNNKWKMIFEQNCQIIATGGYTHLPAHVPAMQSNTEDDEGINIVIFDADEEGHGRGSFDNTKKSLDAFKTTHEVHFDFHLWPNHEKNGRIEDLLQQLIPQDKKTIFECIDQYNTCLKQIEGVSVDDSIKRALNVYTYSFNHAKKESERKYQDDKFWTLDHDTITDLKRLKTFLDEFFQDKMK